MALTPEEVEKYRRLLNVTPEPAKRERQPKTPKEPAPRRRGGRPSRLTEAQKEYIRVFAEIGIKHALIAASFGIHPSYVSAITRRGKSTHQGGVP